MPRLGKAKREGTLGRLLADVAKARPLRQVVSESHEGRSVISAANVESGRWGTAFAADKLAAAIVDHVVQQSGFVEFGGPSRRLEESLMLGSREGRDAPARP